MSMFTPNRAVKSEMVNDYVVPAETPGRQWRRQKAGLLGPLSLCQHDPLLLSETELWQMAFEAFVDLGRFADLPLI